MALSCFALGERRWPGGNHPTPVIAAGKNAEPKSGNPYGVNDAPT